MYTDERTGSTLVTLVATLLDARGDLFRIKRAVGVEWAQVEHVICVWFAGSEGWLSELRGFEEVAA